MRTPKGTIMKTKQDAVPVKADPRLGGSYAVARKILGTFFLLLLSGNVHAALNVFACEPEWAALTQQLAGDKASIYTATGPLQARPSLIAKARSAQLLVCTGAELEIGWMPVV